MTSRRLWQCAARWFGVAWALGVLFPPSGSIAVPAVRASPRIGAAPRSATGPSSGKTGRAASPCRGKVAVFKEDLPVGGDGSAEGIASSPDGLADVLLRAGFAVIKPDAAQLSEGRLLNRSEVDVLILPYGPSFPVAAAEPLRRFLREGGKLVAIGGYAFDHLLTRSADKWQPYSPAPPQGPPDARWRFEIPAEDIRGKGHLTLSGWAQSKDIVGREFAFLSVYQYDATGELVEFRDIAKLRGPTPWRHYAHTFQLSPRTARLWLYAGMWDCAGVSWFDDIRLLDATGKTLVDAAAKPDANVDATTPRAWNRTERTLCALDPSVRHAGRASLKVTLAHAVIEERLNTRKGRPADGLEVDPKQLGVFDADYRIRRACSVRPSSDQSVFGTDWSIGPPLNQVPITGYAACGVLGHNTARWRPLLDATDVYGRLRGTAGAIIHHYGGTWKGSSWAIFGLTSHDVFGVGRHGSNEALVRLVEHLVRDAYLVSILTDKACCSSGETIRVSVHVFNAGREPLDLSVKTLILSEDSSHRVHERTDRLSPAPGSPGRVEFQWPVAQSGQSFYRLRAELSLATTPDRPIDVIEGGCVVRQDRVIASGPQLTYRDNYLHVGDQPLFLFGTDDWSYVFGMDRETPLQWRRDMALRRDFGVTLYENLQIGLPDSPAALAGFLNQVEGLAQLAQQYAQVYFPCLLCGHDVAVDDATLKKHAAFAGTYAQRVARFPGLIYYLNGDLRCRITPAVQNVLNEFLKDRYGQDARLQDAWNDRNVRLGQVVAEEYPENGMAWSDVRAYDFNLFRAALIRRWHDGLIEAIRRHDTVHPTSSEFYQLPWTGVDVPAGIGRLDLSNIGFFEEPLRDIRRLPLLLKYNDLRSRGKSFGPGEYGVKTHPAWRAPEAYGYHKARTPEQAVDLFLSVGHYTLGLGGSRIHNWCWKDSSHGVFPWGMIYPCDEVEKDTAYVHRNQSLLFRHLRPVYEPPAVYVMTPDTHRLGGQKTRVIEAVLNSIQLVMGAHVDGIGMLNEHELVIPSAAKVVFRPVPFCLEDAAYRSLVAFVRAGGMLYVSGDVSYDPLRRRTQTQRLTELCGVRFVKEQYAGIDLEKGPAEDLLPTDANRPVIHGAKPCMDMELAGATPLWTTRDGRPVVTRYPVGKGGVIFSTDPVELRADRARLADDIPLYRLVLDAAGVPVPRLDPDNPYVHVMRVPMRDGGRVFVFYNADDSTPQQTLRWDGPFGAVTLGIRRHRPALLWFDGKGRLRAAEVQGELRIGRQPVLDDGTDGIVMSLDGLDVRESAALLMMPIQAGPVRLTRRACRTSTLLEVGDIRGGRWRSLELSKPWVKDNTVHVEVDARQVFSLILLCEKTKLAAWRETVEQSVRNPVAAR